MTSHGIISLTIVEMSLSNDIIKEVGLSLKFQKSKDLSLIFRNDVVINYFLVIFLEFETLEFTPSH